MRQFVSTLPCSPTLSEAQDLKDIVKGHHPYPLSVAPATIEKNMTTFPVAPVSDILLFFLLQHNQQWWATHTYKHFRVSVFFMEEMVQLTTKLHYLVSTWTPLATLIYIVCDHVYNTGSLFRIILHTSFIFYSIN